VHYLLYSILLNKFEATDCEQLLFHPVFLLNFKFVSCLFVFYFTRLLIYRTA